MNVFIVDERLSALIEDSLPAILPSPGNPEEFCFPERSETPRPYPATFYRKLCAQDALHVEGGRARRFKSKRTGFPMQKHTLLFSYQFIGTLSMDIRYLDSL